MHFHNDDVTNDERERFRTIFEEKGLIYYDSIPPIEAVKGDYFSVISSIPNRFLRHTDDDLRVVIDVYRSFDIEINSLKECDALSFFFNKSPDGRILLKCVVRAGALKSRSTEKEFYVCVDVDGTVHCRNGVDMYRHGVIYHFPPDTSGDASDMMRN